MEKIHYTILKTLYEKDRTFDLERTFVEKYKVNFLSEIQEERILRVIQDLKNEGLIEVAKPKYRKHFPMMAEITQKGKVVFEDMHHKENMVKISSSKKNIALLAMIISLITLLISIFILFQGGNDF